MKESNEGNIECCQNCQTHQNFARHSEWKYFQQFNELKRKIEKFINNTIVIKNPVPDELIKTQEIKNQKNVFMNKVTNERIVFPRIGSFQIYIYNILISSKLMTNQWPNHYKILQVLAKIIEEKKKGNSIDHYSVYYQNGLEAVVSSQIQQISKELSSPDKRSHRIVSKKKKIANPLAGRVYKSIERGNEIIKDLKSTLEPLSAKLIDEKDPLQSANNRIKKNVNRYLESKADARIKLPSLNASINIREDSQIQKKSTSNKPIFNSIEQFQKTDLSMIQRNLSDVNDDNKFSQLQLKQDQLKKSASLLQDNQDLKFLQNRSVQYSQQNQNKQFMNRSIQYEEQEGFYCDFGIQIDQKLTALKEIQCQFVQTERIELVSQPKPYMLDQNVQANIQIIVPIVNREIQTIIKEFVDQNQGTELISTVNRGYQFPEENMKAVNSNQIIDVTFQHLYQKRRNIMDNEYYSIDRFQQKPTKYKWIGRSNISDHSDQLKKKIFLQCLVFSVYNYYGIKTPQKRLSYQLCSNVVGDKLKDSSYHIMTFDNPELQYLFQFQQCNREQEKYPLSQLITFRTSKQIVKFKNYGGLLGLAYFMNDYEVFNQSNNQIGVVIVNEAVKEIHKISALNYQIHPNLKNTEDQIIVDGNGQLTIKLNRLSQAVQLQFFSMLARICDSTTFQQLINHIRQIFVHESSTYQQFKATIISLHLQKSQTEVVQDFILMLTDKVQKIRQIFKGKLYTYTKYHTLTPTIKYNIPFQLKLDRKLKYKQKIVSVGDVIKIVLHKDHIVILQGEDGMGKSTVFGDMVKQLREVDKVNVIEFNWLKKESNKVKEELFQLTQNVIFIDNVELFQIEVKEVINKFRKSNFNISYCMATSKSNQGDVFKNYFSNLTIVQTQLLPFDAEQIKNYMMKVIKNQSFTNKKEHVQKLVQSPKYISILKNPFFLSLYAQFVSGIDLEHNTFQDRDITKYRILKQHFNHCTTVHTEQMKEMDIKIKDTFLNLRRMAFEYFHNNRETNQLIKEIITPYQQNQLIRSQMAYYPINLDSTISSSYQPLFCHNLFLNFFLIEAYSYYVEKAYRNMRMQKLYSDSFLMDLIIERYRVQETHSQLLQVVLTSKKFRNIVEASSNALTLLCRMGYVFSNINFDDCVISDADLSSSIFYQCSFRGSDLEQAVLYKSQMISCIFDNSGMSKINLYSKKYQIQFTAMTASLSADGRRIAFGCGNYLIVINSETGSEIKRIEAHLDVIRMVKYTRDGNSLITVADDKTLRIWDVITYKSVVFRLPQKGSINYSNQTETIASVNKNVLKVWNLKSMANEAELDGHGEIITSVQFSYNGELILTGSKDTTLRLWTLKGKQKVVYKGHESQIIVGKLSPTNRTMVSCSKDKDLIMWQVESGSKILSKKFMSEITQICLDNMQKYIIITFNNDNHIVILDFITFDIVHTLSGHQARIISISFDHKFQQIVSLAKDRTVRMWQFDKIMEIQTKKQKIYNKIQKGQVLALAYDTTKLKYATSHEGGQINIWNAVDNQLLDQVISHVGPVKCLCFDLSGKLYSGGSDGTLRIWNLQVRRQPKNIEIHSSEMLQLKLSQKNRIIATCSMTNQLVVHDFTGIKIIMSTRQQGRVNAIQFSQDEKIMAVGGAQKYIVLYEIGNGNTVTRSTQLGQHTDAISSLCFFGESLLVCALKNGQVAIWNHYKANLIKKIENVSPIRAILSFQKKYICFSSQDGKIRIVNMDEGKEVKVFRYSQFPTAIDTNQNESILYVGTNLGNILKWNLNCVLPLRKKIDFDRKAIDADCTRIVSIQSGRTLLIKDLYYHKEQFVDVKADSDIEGVTFDGDKIILLLKNGKYWQVGKKQYKFNNQIQNTGDLLFIRDKSFTNFYRSGIKKVKGMNKPTLSILEEVNS